MRHEVTRVKFSIEQGTTLHTVAIEPQNVFDVVMLFTAQVKRNVPAMARDDALHLARMTTGKMLRTMGQVVGKVPDHSANGEGAQSVEAQCIAHLIKGKSLPAALKADLAWKRNRSNDEKPEPAA